MVLGCAVVKPPASPEVASDSLAEAIEMASSNRIPAPSRVRVDSEETADALRRSHPSIAVECGPIPSLAHLAKDVAQFFDGSLSDLEPLYFPNVRTDDVLRSSTQAFLELHQSRPWSWVPSDVDAFILNFPECGLHDAAICVIGQAGMNRAALIFDSADEFERYIVACVGQDEKSAGSFPKNLSISFDPPSKVEREIQKKLTHLGWKTSDPREYPILRHISQGGSPIPLTEADFIKTEAVARVLVAMETKSALYQDAWNARAQRQDTIQFSLGGKACTATVHMPHVTASTWRDDHTLARIAQLRTDEEGFYDAPLVRKLEKELLDEFKSSPEARAAQDDFLLRIALEFSISYYGVTLPNLRPYQLKEMLVVHLPREVNIRASQAKRVLGDMQAYYEFLRRRYELSSATACIEALGGETLRLLYKALADVHNYGPAKSIVMAGLKAGHDMTTEEGVSNWLKELGEGSPLARPSAKRKKGSSPRKRQP